MRINYFFFIGLFSLFTCQSYQAADHVFPKPVDTSSRPIEYQRKMTYAIDGVFADNQFDGARLNDFSQIDTHTFRAIIRPENTPINNSPWYAFKLWSNSQRTIQLVLQYENGEHRYAPKISKDGENWAALDSSAIFQMDSINVLLELPISSDTLWLAAQEIVPSSKVYDWCQQQATHPAFQIKWVGKSPLNKDLVCLEIGEGDPRKKEMIVVLSRQHPPEVTGFYAMQAFIEEIRKDNFLSNTFRKKYRLLVFPLMNPDGVDLGHWRHNSGGIDLNRDWAYYRQTETRQVADYIVETAKKNKSKVLIGLDFHSTWYDVYYTGSEELTAASNIPHFQDLWLLGIEGAMEDYDANEKPSGYSRPVTKGWFYKQFNAEGITYEIGDDTPRTYIQHKGSVAAREMMSLLVCR